MSDENLLPREKSLHLNVLPTTGAQGKVEELKKQFAADASSSHATGQNANQVAPDSLITRALEGDLSEDQKIVRERIIEALQTVYDPELPVNLYDLGLIYDIALDADMNAHIKMTLTAPGCPVAGTLPGEVERKIACVMGVQGAKVELVWSPPWGKERMSESALLELGLL